MFDEKLNISQSTIYEFLFFVHRKFKHEIPKSGQVKLPALDIKLDSIIELLKLFQKYKGYLGTYEPFF